MLFRNLSQRSGKNSSCMSRRNWRFVIERHRLRAAWAALKCKPFHPSGSPFFFKRSIVTSPASSPMASAIAIHSLTHERATSFGTSTSPRSTKTSRISSRFLSAFKMEPPRLRIGAASMLARPPKRRELPRPSVRPWRHRMVSLSLAPQAHCRGSRAHP